MPLNVVGIIAIVLGGIVTCDTVATSMCGGRQRFFLSKFCTVLCTCTGPGGGGLMDRAYNPHEEFYLSVPYV